jgi:hypothetical protein
MFLIYHPVHAPTMPRSCSSLEEFEQLKTNGWYTEGELPSPISPGDVPVTNADDSNKPNPLTPNAGAREEEKVDTDDDPATDNDTLLVTELNVADAKELIIGTFDTAVLTQIRKEEKAHKDRVGVLNAIDDQRELIKNTDPAT